LNFGTNIGLSPNQGVGLLGTYNFSYQITLTNLNTENMELELYTVVDSVGTFTIQNQQVVKQVGIVTSKDVIDADDVKQASSEDIERMSGASFMTGVKNLYTKVKDVGKKVAPVLEKAAPIIGKAADYLDEHPKLQKGLKIAAKGAAAVAPILLAAGYTPAQLREMEAAGYTESDFKKMAKRIGGNAVGGNMVGGAYLPKKKLMNRAVNYNGY
jgi:hypothetical protein